MMKAIILDTETTGIKDAIPVEVAYIDISRMFCDGKFNTLIEGIDEIPAFLKNYNPLKVIEFGAMATHHITNEDVEDCEPYTNFKLPAAEYVIGHNIDFDMRVINACGKQPEVKTICTLALSRYFYPDIDSHKLAAMLYALDVKYAVCNAKNAHSALADCYMTLQLLQLMMGKIGATSFDALYEISEKAKIPSIITFGKHKGTTVKDLPIDYKFWLLKQPDLDRYLRQALNDSLRGLQ